MIKSFFCISAILWIATTAITGQGNTSLTAEDSDPEASTLLEKMEEFISDRERYTASFKMEITIPGSETIKYEGSADQDGAKFYIETQGYKIFCDGLVRWVYLDESNEVNIYSVESDGAPTTPLQYLTLYKDEEFVYRLADEYAGKGERAIEFKPLDQYSDYTKIRLTLSSDHRPKKLELFENGGVRTTLEIVKIEEAAAFPTDHFTFKEADYPDIHVEDLRID